MLTQLIVASAAAGARQPGAALQIALAKPPQFHIKNSVKLRGFLVEDAKVPPSAGITEDAFAILFLATMSGTWVIATNEWTPRITRHRIVCPGPFFCGLTRGMRHGDYVEVEGELYIHDYERPVVVEGERFTAKRYVTEIRAIQVRRLDRPMELVDTGEDG